MIEVEKAFIDRFGPYAGWAHNVLFISDLASSKQYLPENLRPPESSTKKRKRAQAKVEIFEAFEGQNLEGEFPTPLKTALNFYYALTSSEGLQTLQD